MLFDQIFDQPDRIIEIFAIIGAPARVVGRLPLFSRQIWNGFSSPWPRTDYAETRYGKGYKWRPWLLFDVTELEIIEELINNGSDEKILAHRQSQLLAFQMVAIIGALVAQATIQALELPLLDQVHYIVRGLFNLSLVTSLLAVFFTCLQQRSYGFLEGSTALRVWLSNGTQYTNAEGNPTFRSSIVSHQLLQAPFELLSISITLFLLGIGFYLVSAMTENLELSSGSVYIGNRGVLIAFVIGTLFGLGLFGQLLGGKDIESEKCRQNAEMFLKQAGSVDQENRFGWTPNRRREAEKASYSRTREGVRTSPGDFDRSNMGDLSRALQKAAAAHRDYAKAEADLASQYERLAAQPGQTYAFGIGGAS